MSGFDDLVRRAKEEIEKRLHKTAPSDLEASHEVALQSLGDALDLQDGSSGGHCRRVCAYSMAIGRAAGLPPDRVASLARGAFLHDIGKMAISDKIRLKPGKLTLDETVTMREHARVGYLLAKEISFLVPEPAEVIYAHHEHYDGTGYPRGLKGQDIPFGARIVAVANTLDSITSDLPYREARNLAVAREEIQAGSGRQFDPEVVAVFQIMPNEIFEELRRAIDAPGRP